MELKGEPKKNLLFEKSKMLFEREPFVTKWQRAETPRVLMSTLIPESFRPLWQTVLFQTAPPFGVIYYNQLDILMKVIKSSQGHMEQDAAPKACKEDEDHCLYIHSLDGVRLNSLFLCEKKTVWDFIKDILIIDDFLFF